MTLSDFRKAPRGPYAFDIWEHPNTVSSPLGDFGIELLLFDEEPPDARMVEDVERLAEFVRRNPSQLVEKVHEHYRRIADQDWLRACGVPAGLAGSELGPYLKVRNLVASRDHGDDARSYDNWIYISPLWDEEHAIYLGLRRDGLAFRDP